MGRGVPPRLLAPFRPPRAVAHLLARRRFCAGRNPGNPGFRYSGHFFPTGRALRPFLNPLRRNSPCPAPSPSATLLPVRCARCMTFGSSTGHSPTNHTPAPPTTISCPQCRGKGTPMIPIIERTAKPSGSRISLEIPEEFRHFVYRVVMIPITEENSTGYDFSRFEGKLQWTGDAVEEQRRLRDEW